MRVLLFKSGLMAAVLLISLLINNANAGIIFSENFDGSSSALENSIIVDWQDSTGGGFEVYSALGASARGMSSLYDHDNNPDTAKILIPGGLEVNDRSGDVFLTATFTLDSAINDLFLYFVFLSD